MTDDSLKAVRHVQEMQVIDGKDYEGIKEAVFKYGGVESSLYSTIRSSQRSIEVGSRIIVIPSNDHHIMIRFFRTNITIRTCILIIIHRTPL